MTRCQFRGYRPAVVSAIAAVALAVVAGATDARAQVQVVTNASADQVLKPGDMMFKLLNEKSQASSVGISLAESAIKALDGKFNSAVARGDAQAVHVAVYIGGGMTAEAHGKTDGEQAGVSLRHIEHHALVSTVFFRSESSSRTLYSLGVRWIGTPATAALRVSRFTAMSPVWMIDCE